MSTLNKEFEKEEYPEFVYDDGTITRSDNHLIQEYLKKLVIMIEDLEKRIEILEKA